MAAVFALSACGTSEPTKAEACAAVEEEMESVFESMNAFNDIGVIQTEEDQTAIKEQYTELKEQAQAVLDGIENEEVKTEFQPVADGLIELADAGLELDFNDTDALNDTSLEMVGMFQNLAEPAESFAEFCDISL